MPFWDFLNTWGTMQVAGLFFLIGSITILLVFAGALRGSLGFLVAVAATAICLILTTLGTKVGGVAALGFGVGMLVVAFFFTLMLLHKMRRNRST